MEERTIRPARDLEIERLIDRIPERTAEQRRPLPRVIDSGFPEIGETKARVDGNDIGRLSAEAVMAQFEQTAKAIEDMGEIIRDCAAKLEAELNDHHHNIKMIAEAAKAIRDKGHHSAALIEHSGMMTRELRNTIKSLMDKVG